MVQVLPYVQTPLEQLTPYITQAAGQVGQSFAQRSALKKLQEYDKASSAQKGPDGQYVPLTPIEFAQRTAMAKNAGLDPHAYSQSLLANQKLQNKAALDIQKEERAGERKLQEAEQLPFIEKIARDRDTLPAAIQSNDQIIDAIIKGDVGPGSMPHLGAIARDLGVPSSITKLLESTDSKEFNSGVKLLMGKTIKDTFRGTTSKREIEIAEQVQAEIGVKPEANLAAAWAVQADLMARQEEIRLYDELLEQGVSRTKIPAVINKQMLPYRKQLKEEYFQAIDELRKKK